MTEQQTSAATWWQRIPSNWGIWGGIAFCFAYVVLIRALAPYLPAVDFAPDTGGTHYLWKLPDPTTLSRFTAWAGYILHQSVAWGILYWAQNRELKYSDNLHPVNLVALGANGLFILLHLLQTHYAYDGLAQDTHIFTSQGSVVILLAMILVMENQRRGLIAGHRAPFMAEAARAMRKYHGYIFSWAIVYTFWYHPMESTTGHLFGTFYTTLIMVQGSLFFTRAHLNRWWTMTMEVMVLFHGTVVAINQGNGAWGQFGFGFFAMFVFTQMYGLGLSNWVRWLFWGLYVGGIAVAYHFARGWENIAEVIRIPVVLYGLAFIFSFITWGLIVLARGASREKAPA